MRSLWKTWQWYWFDRRMRKQWKNLVAVCKPVECPPETEVVFDVSMPPCTCGEESCPDAKR